MWRKQKELFAFCLFNAMSMQSRDGAALFFSGVEEKWHFEFNGNTYRMKLHDPVYRVDLYYETKPNVPILLSI